MSVVVVFIAGLWAIFTSSSLVLGSNNCMDSFIDESYRTIQDGGLAAVATLPDNPDIVYSGLTIPISCCGELMEWRFCISDPTKEGTFQDSFEASVLRLEVGLTYRIVHREIITVEAINQPNQAFKCYSTNATENVMIESNDLVSVRIVTLLGGSKLVICKSENCKQNRIIHISQYNDTYLVANSNRISFTYGTLSLQPIISEFILHAHAISCIN